MTAADRVAHDGTRMSVVKVIEARTREIADAVFDEWQEREQAERVHSRGCWDGGACWCSS